MKDYVSYLASDALAGREVGSDGIRMAEEYIASIFTRYGLKPLPGKADYFLDFSLYKYGFDAARSSFSVSLSGKRLTGVLQEDYTPLIFSGTGKNTAGLIFAGYGITAPEYHYDDYAGLPVVGKFVLVMRHEPNRYDPRSRFANTASTSYAYIYNKMANARKHGAAGMILINDPLFRGAEFDLRTPAFFSLTSESGKEGKQVREFLQSDSDFIVLAISSALADKIISSSGYNLVDIQTAIDKGAKPWNFSLKDVTVSASLAKNNRPELVKARNVAGYIKGSHPQLENQWIVIGAHHDHIGAFKGRGDTVYNGADDNASGVSAVLELAKAFSRLDKKTARSLIFITFSAEEEGLFGSEEFIGENIPSKDSIKYMVNIDMIGKNPDEPLRIFTTGAAGRIRSAVPDLNSDSLVISDKAYAPEEYLSDDSNFSGKGIPTISFFTGVHDDYHAVSDHAEKLDYNRMEKIVRFIYKVIEKLAGGQD